MSDQVKSEPLQECGLCGISPVPTGCAICNGNNQRFIRTRQYTQTEEHQGHKSDPDRYGPGGTVHPKIVNLPGSFNPAGG